MFSAASASLAAMATAAKRTTTKKLKGASKAPSKSRGRPMANGIGPIKSRPRREAIEALIEYTTKDKELSPEVEATLKDDAWGKRLVNP